MQGNIKVVVRCRPLNARELARGATCLVKMENNQTILQNPKSKDDIKAFTFDKSYWSAGNKTDSDYADQEAVYNDVGREWLNHAFDGYNCCIFAYGQTGSGKSYSMIGYGEDKGIIPRTCSELFNRINQNPNPSLTYCAEVSYIEIYNERVRDLLNPRTKHLKVREHPSLGPYVEDLSRLVVNSFEDIEHLMDEGNKARTVAATNMNETSSRSHAVFTIILTQKITDTKTNQQSEKVSRFSLVDLAGSERANSTGASGMRLKEGANINRSLTTLGKVIAGLADQTTTTSAPSPLPSNAKSHKKRDSFIPYRDSVLTWLLKDSLGGNSKTAMIAAISPADFDETLSTLRYADQAKKIKTKAVVNEDPNVRMIRDLKTEIQNLKQSLLTYVPHPEQLQLQQQHQDNEGSAIGTEINSQNNDMTTTVPVLPSKSVIVKDAYGNATELTKRQVVEQIKSSQKLLGDIDQSWEDRLQTTIQIQQDREHALAELGITVAKNEMGVYTPKKVPYLVNLNEDPLMSECLVYQIKPGTTLVGGRKAADNNGDNEMDGMDDGDDSDNNKKQYIRLTGSNILENHCRLENMDQVVTIYPNNDDQSVTMVNGIHITTPKELKNGYRIILGDYHVFRFNHPEQARRERDEQKMNEQPSDMTSHTDDYTDDLSIENGVSTTGTISTTTQVDWLFARKEAVMHYFQQQQQQQQQQQYSANAVDEPISPTTPAGFENLTNEELEKLFDDVAKMRNIRKRQSSHSGGVLSQPMSPCSSTSSFSFRHSATPSTVSTIMYGENGGFYGSASSTDDTDSMVDREIIRLAREELQQELDEQKVKYEKRIQRLSSLYPLATVSTTTTSGLSFPPYPLLSPSSFGYSDDDKSTLAKIIDHWRDQRYVHLAETLLMNGATLYEVNALARQLDKKVVYQLTIIHNIKAAAGSAWEEDVNAARLDKTLLASKKPCIGVRVIDSKHQCTYLWSLDRLKTRLRYMQGIRFVSDQAHHLVTTMDNNQDNYGNDQLDLFYDSHPPQFALIGMAKMRLRHLALHAPMERTLDVFCQRTCRVVGKLNVLIAPIARSKERQPQQQNHSTTSPMPTSSFSQRTVTEDNVNQQQQHDGDDVLQSGQRLVFEVRIGELSGVKESDFTHVHAQFRLDAFGAGNDQIYATSCASQFEKHVSIDFDYSKTFSMVVSDDILTAIQYDDLIFEVYGQPQSGYLKSFQDEPCASHQLPSVEKKHNVYAWIEILELARVSGEYTSVQVNKPPGTRLGSRLDDDSDDDDDILDEDQGFILASSLGTRSTRSSADMIGHHLPQGIFMLRQGQQRRIVLTIRHDWKLPPSLFSGEDSDKNGGNENDHDGLTLDGVDGLILWIGDIRLRSPKTQGADNDTADRSTPAQDISIPLTLVRKTKDTLELQGAWDSSLHNSLLLNRLTGSGTTVDLTLKWIFHGAPFQMDIGVQITSGGSNGMIKRQSLLRNLFTSASSNSSRHSDDDDDDDDACNEIGFAAIGSGQQGKKKSSLTGIYRVWERPRRLSSYQVRHETNSDHHEWQQHQMQKIRTYDMARRSMLTKMEVANTRYTLTLLDLLQKRRGAINDNRRVDLSSDENVEQQQLNRKYMLHSIVQQWMDSKREERTGLHLINTFGSTDQLESPIQSVKHDIPLYDIHQITLR
ncbi:unnamed protein product [Absidia cylindrospora]